MYWLLFWGTFRLFLLNIILRTWELACSPRNGTARGLGSLIVGWIRAEAGAQGGSVEAGPPACPWGASSTAWTEGGRPTPTPHPGA